MELNDVLNSLNLALGKSKGFRAIETFYPTKVFSYRKYVCDIYLGKELYYSFSKTDQFLKAEESVKKLYKEILTEFFKKYNKNGVLEG